MSHMLFPPISPSPSPSPAARPAACSKATNIILSSSCRLQIITF